MSHAKALRAWVLPSTLVLGRVRPLDALDRSWAPSSGRATELAAAGLRRLLCLIQSAVQSREDN